MDKRKDNRFRKVEFTDEQERRIVELRTKEKLNWKKTTEKFNKEFGTDYVYATIQKAYFRKTSKAILNDKRVDDQSYKDYQMIHKRYVKACKVIDNLMDEMEKLREELSQEDMPQLHLKYAKEYIPLLINLSREVVNQLNYLKQEQEKIQVQQKNYLINPIQINAHLSKSLEYLREKGFVKILKPIQYSTDND